MLSGTERHPHARAVLTAALPPTGDPSHAYLFHGPAGSGKRDVARSFAAALLADGAPDPGGAARRVRSGAHPDLTWVAPTSSAGLLVGDVDQAVVAAAAKTPFEARRRVFVVEAAEELNDQAANRMLKTLEEPAAFAHLVLLSSRPEEVLPTIASRCQHVRFDAPSPEEIADRLAGQGVGDPAAATACARLALGDADRALALATGDGPALREAAEGLARAIVTGALAERPWRALLAQARTAGERAVAEVDALTRAELELVPAKERRRVEREAADRARRAQRRAATAALDAGLGLTGLYLRDVACAADGVPELVHHADRMAQVREAAGRAGSGAAGLRGAHELVEETRRRLDRNVGEELALEQLASRAARRVAGAGAGSGSAPGFGEP